MHNNKIFLKTRHFFHLLEYKILRKLHRIIVLFKNIMFEIKIIMKNDSLLVKRNQNLYRGERILYSLSFLKNNMIRRYTFSSVKYRRLFFSIWLSFETFAFYLFPDGKILFPRENWKQLRISYHARWTIFFYFFFIFLNIHPTFLIFIYFYSDEWIETNTENLCCHVLNTRIYSLLFFFFFFFVGIEICGNKKDIGYRKSFETSKRT